MAYNQPYYNGGYYPQYQNGAVPDMLGQYKGQYQQPIPQNMQMPITPIPQKPTNDIIWVQGLEGAKGYLVAPNNTVVLWDTESSVIYVKSADASGIPSMRVLDFKERNGNSQNIGENPPKTHKCACGDEFATKEQLSALEGKINDILDMYEELKDKQTTKTVKPTKKEVE
jgi:hypothetical protein